MDEKKIYATLEDIENMKQEVIEEVLATVYPAAEEASF